MLPGVADRAVAVGVSRPEMRGEVTERRISRLGSAQLRGQVVIVIKLDIQAQRAVLLLDLMRCERWAGLRQSALRARDQRKPA